MVERGDVTGDRQHRVGQPEVVGRHVGQALDLAHDVVAEVADDAAVERRELVDVRRAVAREQRLERGERARSVGTPGGGVPSNSTARPRATSVSAGSRPRNENRPHRSACSTDSRRNPGGSSRPRPELHERRDRRLEVGEHLAPHGTTVWSRASATNSSRDGRRRHGRVNGAGRGAAAEGAEEAAALAGVARAPALLLDDEEQASPSQS